MRSGTEHLIQRATRQRLTYLLLPLALAACGKAPSDAPDPRGERELRTTITSFPTRHAPVEEVEVLVPAEAAPGQPVCEGPLPFQGQVRYAFRWTDGEGKLIRLVYTFFDDAGAPRKYSDVRGAATNVRSPATEPGTFILIDLPDGRATIQNQGTGAGAGYIVPLDAALDAATLDFPRRWIQRLQDECMGARN